MAKYNNRVSEILNVDSYILSALLKLSDKTNVSVELLIDEAFEDICKKYKKNKSERNFE